MYETKRQFACIITGFIFAAGWWMFISGVWYNQTVSHHGKFYGYEVLPGIGATIAFICINVITLNSVIGGSSNSNHGCNIFVKFWFYLCIAVFFMCGGSAIWIWIKFFYGTWTGVSIFLQVMMIMIASIFLLIMRYILD